MEPLVPLIGPEDLAPEARAVYDHVARARGGWMGNVFRALANSPPALEKVAALGEFVRFQSSLDPVLRETVILTVARETRCAYEWAHHYPLAERLPAPPELLASVRTRDVEREEGATGAAARLARLVAEGREVDEATARETVSLLGPAALIELMVCAGYYVMLARVINSLRVPLDEDMEAVDLPWADS